MKRKPRFGGGLGRFARKFIPSRKKPSSWWDVPLAEDELDSPYTRPHQAAPADAPITETRFEAELIEDNSQQENLESASASLDGDTEQTRLEAEQQEDRFFDVEGLSEEPVSVEEAGQEPRYEEPSQEWTFSELLDEQQEASESTDDSSFGEYEALEAEPQGEASNDLDDFDSLEEFLEANEDEQEEEAEAPQIPVFASSLEQPRWRRLLGALQFERVKAIRKITSIRLRKGKSSDSAGEWSSEYEGPESKPPSRVTAIWLELKRRTRLLKRQVMTYVLRRPPLLEDDEDSPKQEIEEVHAEWTSLITPPKEERWWSFRNIKQVLDNFLIRKTITLTVENGIVRVVVFKGKEAIAWGTAYPDGAQHHNDAEDEETEQVEGYENSIEASAENEDNSSIDSSTEESEDEEGEASDDGDSEVETGALTDADAPRLRSLLKQLNFRRTRLVTELPLYSPLLRFMQLPRIRKGYVQDVIFAELEDAIPFTQDEVDIKWQAQQGQRGAEILAIAARKKAIDSHIRILRDAQAQPLASYTRAISLAYASGIPNVIVVHLAANEAGIVLVREGIPRVVHRLELGEYEEDVQATAESIARAVEHVDDFYHSNELRDIHASFSVVLTGDNLDTDDSLMTAFEEASSHQVRAFKPPIACPENFPLNEYAANVGLVTVDRARARYGGKIFKAKGPAINMLSERHLPKPLPVMQAAVFAMLVISGAAAFNVTTQVDAKSLEAATLTNQVASLDRQVRQHRLTAARIASLESQIKTATRSESGLNLQLDILNIELQESISRMEAITSNALPDGVRVSNFFIQGDEVILSGAAPTFFGATRYTSNLRSLGRRMFISANIDRMEASSAAGENRVSFQASAKIPAGIASETLGEDEEPLSLEDILSGLEGGDGDGIGDLGGLVIPNLPPDE